MISFLVQGQHLRVTDDTMVVADSYNYLELALYFSDDWADVIAWAEIIAPNGDKLTPSVSDGFVSADKGINLTEGVWEISVVGDRYESGALVKRITTNSVQLTVRPSGIKDGEPFSIDIDAGTEIIARAAAFAEIAEGKVAEAEDQIGAARQLVSRTEQAVEDVRGISAQAAADAATAMNAAKSVPAAVTNANNAATQATRAATQATQASTQTTNLYSAIKAMLDAGKLNGKDGDDGEDGVSPSVRVDRDGKASVVVITDKYGTHGFNVYDGNDGVSPRVWIRDIEGGHRVTITDAEGTKSFDVMDGSGGGDVTEEDIRNALGYEPADQSVVSEQSESIVDHEGRIVTLEAKPEPHDNVPKMRIQDITETGVYILAEGFAVYVDGEYVLDCLENELIQVYANNGSNEVWKLNGDLLDISSQAQVVDGKLNANYYASIPNYVDESISQLAESVASHETSIGEITTMLQHLQEISALPVSLAVPTENRGPISTVNGTISVNTTSGYVHSPMIDIRPYSRIVYTRPTSANASGQAAGIAFYDSAQKFISCVPIIYGYSKVTYVTSEAEIPANAVYARFGKCYSESAGNYEAYGYKR